VLAVSYIGRFVMMFAYVHCRPDGTPFYVGKGSFKRSNIILNKHLRNAYHQNIVKKHGKGSILVGRLECSSEEIAFELEKGLIKCLRNSGASLTNLTDGGEGTSGVKRGSWTEEQRDKMRGANNPAVKNRGSNLFVRDNPAKKEENTLRMRENNPRRRGDTLGTAHRENISIALKAAGTRPSKEALEKSITAKKTAAFKGAQSERMREYYRLNPHKVKGFSKKQPILPED
jgi:hypothetical protein